MTTAPAVLRLGEISSIESLEALAPEWQKLWERCPDATPFQSPQWLLPWLRKLFQGGEIWVLTLREGERLAGVAPLLIHRHWRNAGTRQVSLIGAGISDYLDFLIEPACTEAAVPAFLGRLLEHRSRWDICDFQELRETSPMLASAFPPGLQFALSDCGICPVVRLPESIAELRASLPAKFRTDLHRAGNRFRNAGGVAFETATAANMPEFMEALFRLHSARWELRRETGVLCTDEIRNFHQQVAAGFLQLGQLRVHGLRYQSSIAAVVYSFVRGQRTYAYLGGFDPALGKLSPGAVLMEFSIEQSILEGVREYDFLRKREEYKYLWGATDRPSRRILAWHSDSVLPSPDFPQDEPYEHN